MSISRSIAFLVLLFITTTAFAADPFVYTVTTTSGPPLTLRVPGTNIVHVTDDVILGRGAAAAIGRRDVVATLNYAGVPNALRLTLNASRTSATLAYPISGGVQNFSSAFAPTYLSPALVLDNQVFFAITNPDSRNWESLQRELNRQSFIMPADGNPSAATAFLADDAFEKYALVRDKEPAGGGAVLYPVPRGPLVTFDMGGGSIQTQGFSGYDVRFAIDVSGNFTRQIGWSVSLPFQYRNIEGAESYTTAIEFGVPIQVLPPRPSQRLFWTLTPFIEFGTSDSTDLGSTVYLFSPGIASRLALRLGQWTLCLANQFSAYIDLGESQQYDWYGFPITTFNGDMSQQVVKNAVQLSRSISRDFSLQASLTYTSFLQNAAVDNYFTPALGINWQVDPHVTLRAKYAANLANHYTGQHGDFTVDFRF